MEEVVVLHATPTFAIRAFKTAVAAFAATKHPIVALSHDHFRVNTIHGKITLK